MSERTTIFKIKLIGTIGQFVSLSMVLLAAFIFLRLFETVILGLVYHFPAGSAKFEFLGFRFDFLVFLKISGFLVLPFVLISMVSQRASEFFYIIMACIIVLISLLLEFYFADSMEPLGSDLFAYSWNEIKLVAGSTGVVSFLTLLSFIIFLTLTILLLLLLKKKRIPNTMLWIFYPLMVVSFIFNTKPDSKDYKTNFDSYLSSNKLGYFASKSYEYFTRTGEIKDLEKNFSLDEKGFDSTEFTYVSNDYPLLHLDETSDVLGNFFTKEKTPPNFVFIIVESLGSAYSGKNAYLHSFTPFLDSLAQYSLYWDNFLSTGGQTFAILPSILASLPFGEKGILEMGDKMPQHLSLIKLLKERGYYTSFIYGGNSHFDFMDDFLKRQGIDKLIDIKSFDSDYTKLPSNEEDFTWGYGDHEVLRKELENSKQAPIKPRLDIILTLAMHSPFKVNNQEYYEKVFEKYLNNLKLTDEEKAERKNYTKQYATVLCFDDGLRHFMKEYSKRDDFKNTIFFITGDHRMPEIPLSTQIDRFHVPLVVYSPLLKRTARFSSISSQFDITPTITAFLGHTYGFQFPLYAHWIGSGLDTARTFRNIHSYPLMRNKNELIDYLDGPNLLANKDFFKIYPTLDIEVEINNTRQAQLTRKFSDYKAINSIVCSQNRIVPDSIYNNSKVSSYTSDSSRTKAIAALRTKFQTQGFSGSGSYSIVVNVFMASNEASDLIGELMKQGYDAHLMTEGTKFIVLVGKYTSKRAANSDLTRIKSKVASNAWVLENK